MFTRVIEAITHSKTDQKIKERDRIAMAALIKDQENRVTFLEARTNAAKSPRERAKYNVKLREEKRQLSQLQNPDETHFFQALGIEL